MVLNLDGSHRIKRGFKLPFLKREKDRRDDQEKCDYIIPFQIFL